MNINILTSIILLSTLMIFSSCEEDDISKTSTETAVLTGYLFANQACDSIRVSKAISYGEVDSTSFPIDNLDITISDGTNFYDLISIGEGYYQNTDFIIESGQNYLLEFEYQNEIVSAQTFVPTKREAILSDYSIEMEKITTGTGPGGGGTQAESVEVSWDNPEGDYYYVVVQNIEEEPEFINDFFADQDSLFRNFNFVSEPQSNDFYNIDPRREIRQFGTHQIIVFRVNPEYAALYNVSDVSSLSITEPPSNVTNGLGILTGVSSDTLYLEVSEI